MDDATNVSKSLGRAKLSLNVDEVARQAQALGAQGPSIDLLEQLAGDKLALNINQLSASYRQYQVLHEIHLRIGQGQSLCLIGPNGAGKSTVLNTIYGLTRITAGSIVANGQDITHLSPNQKLKEASIAYILQHNSIFPGMTVEENLWLGGYLLPHPDLAKERAEKIFEKYSRLKARRGHKAAVLSGGERRLLEVSRALIMNPSILLVDEPSIGLEPRFIDMVFDIFKDLQQNEGKTIIMVEQNAKKGLEFADIGYVLVSGKLALAGVGQELLQHEAVGRLFLGG